MFSDGNDSLDFSDIDGFVMAVACGKCRKVTFCPTPEEAVNAGIYHGMECGSSSIVIAEILATKKYYRTRGAHK